MVNNSLTKKQMPKSQSLFVTRLYQSRIRKRDMTFFLVAAMIAFVAVGVFAVPRVFVHGFWLTLNDFWHSVTH